MSDDRFNRIEAKLDKIHDAVHASSKDQLQRITTLETNQRGIIGISTMIFTALIGAVVRLFIHK